LTPSWPTKTWRRKQKLCYLILWIWAWLAAFKNLLPSGLLGGRNGREKGKAGKLANGKCQMQ